MSKILEEFNENMSSYELRMTYARILFDESVSDGDKKAAEKEYNRLMDENLQKMIGKYLD